MSGGSFNYLCFKEFDEIAEHLPDLRDMAAALTAAGAKSAADETERLIAYIERAQRHIGTRKERLHSVWRAMEWWQSCDIGEDRFREALAKYEAQ